MQVLPFVVLKEMQVLPCTYNHSTRLFSSDHRHVQDMLTLASVSQFSTGLSSRSVTHPRIPLCCGPMAALDVRVGALTIFPLRNACPSPVHSRYLQTRVHVCKGCVLTIVCERAGLTGFLSEQGPFRAAPNGTLTENSYAWNRIANMVFIEQPAGEIRGG